MVRTVKHLRQVRRDQNCETFQVGKACGLNCETFQVGKACDQNCETFQVGKT